MKDIVELYPLVGFVEWAHTNEMDKERVLFLRLYPTTEPSVSLKFVPGYGPFYGTKFLFLKNFSSDFIAWSCFSM